MGDAAGTGPGIVAGAEGGAGDGPAGTEGAAGTAAWGTGERAGWAVLVGTDTGSGAAGGVAGVDAGGPAGATVIGADGTVPGIVLAVCGAGDVLTGAGWGLVGGSPAAGGDCCPKAVPPAAAKTARSSSDDHRTPKVLAWGWWGLLVTAIPQPGRHPERKSSLDNRGRAAHRTTGHPPAAPRTSGGRSFTGGFRWSELMRIAHA